MGEPSPEKKRKIDPSPLDGARSRVGQLAGTANGDLDAGDAKRATTSQITIAQRLLPVHWFVVLDVLGRPRDLWNLSRVSHEYQKLVRTLLHQMSVVDSDKAETANLLVRKETVALVCPQPKSWRRACFVGPGRDDEYADMSPLVQRLHLAASRDDGALVDLEMHAIHPMSVRAMIRTTTPWTKLERLVLDWSPVLPSEHLHTQLLPWIITGCPRLHELRLDQTSAVHATDQWLPHWRAAENATWWRRLTTLGLAVHSWSDEAWRLFTKACPSLTTLVVRGWAWTGANEPVTWVTAATLQLWVATWPSMMHFEWTSSHDGWAAPNMHALAAWSKLEVLGIDARVVRPNGTPRDSLPPVRAWPRLRGLELRPDVTTPAATRAWLRDLNDHCPFVEDITLGMSSSRFFDNPTYETSDLKVEDVVAFVRAHQRLQYVMPLTFGLRSGGDVVAAPETWALLNHHDVLDALVELRDLRRLPTNVASSDEPHWPDTRAAALFANCRQLHALNLRFAKLRPELMPSPRTPLMALTHMVMQFDMPRGHVLTAAMLKDLATAVPTLHSLTWEAKKTALDDWDDADATLGDLLAFARLATRLKHCDIAAVAFRLAHKDVDAADELVRLMRLRVTFLRVVVRRGEPPATGMHVPFVGADMGRSERPVRHFMVSPWSLPEGVT